MKKALSVLLAATIILSCIPLSIGAFAAGEYSVESAVSDPSTSAIQNTFGGVAVDDGMIKADKTVVYGDDEFSAFTNYDEDEFAVELSALGQSYILEKSVTSYEESTVHADVVFVLDISSSMVNYNMAGSSNVTRVNGMTQALNSAINKLYESDPETRIGIVCYGTQYYPNGIYLPIDKYTLPEGDTDYVTFARTKAMGNITVPAGTALFTAVAPRTGTLFLYPGDRTSSTTENTSKYRIQVDANGGIRTYNANSTSVATTGTLADNTYQAYSNYVILRTGSKYWVYDGSQGTQRTGNVTSISTTAKTATINGQSYRFQRSGSYSSGYTISVYIGNSTTASATFTANGASATVNGVTFTRTSYNAVSYSYINLSTTTMSAPVSTAAGANDIASSGCLVNSAGQRMAATSYKVETNKDGTYTQAGLQAARNMFLAVNNNEEDERVPVIVLVSDGVPTYYDSNYTNVASTAPIGNGALNQGAATLNNMAYYTIRTAMDVKQRVNEHYTGQRALFYSIGPGVDFLFGQTVLDPSDENLASCRNNNATNAQSGDATPNGLYTLVNNNLTAEQLEYVDFADWSIAGNLSSSELEDAFSQIVTNITDIPRPIAIKTTTTETGDVFDSDSYITFTDTIGTGMHLVSEPLVRYGNRNYTPTSSSQGTAPEGSSYAGGTYTLYKYDYTVTEESTNLVRYLEDLNVYVITKDGVQTVLWQIPATLLPILYHNINTTPTSYYSAQPIRLIYGVGIEDQYSAGPFYTNSVENPATCTFVPAVGNPYYYYNEKDENGNIISSTLRYTGEENTKTSNETNTLENSSDYDIDSNGKVTVVLGNNGVVELNSTGISLTKIWLDNENADLTRPDSFTIQIYRNGVPFGEPRTIHSDDCSVLGKTWSVYIDGLPYATGDVYTVSELPVPGYEAYYSNNTYSISNKYVKNSLQYELYLVNENGEPIDENGNVVPFANRVVMCDPQKVYTYLNTSETVDYDTLKDLIPDGYYIYNPDASITETIGDSTADTTVTLTDSTDTTIIYYPTYGLNIDESGNVTSTWGFEDVKVAFAIVKVEINPDVVVVDYGKTISTSPLDNDSGAIGIVGIGSMNSSTYYPSVTTQNGTFEVEGRNVIFTPFSYMSSINRVKYYASVKNANNEPQILNSTISVIPATTVYYEDNFGGTAENGGLYIEYTGNWYTVTDNSSNGTQGVNANTNTNDRQDRGEVGQGNTPYGYDSSYDNDIKFSNGTAAKVEGTVSVGANNRPSFDATASFSFKGTGFDIISRTDLNCGMISVYITDEAGNFVDNVPVINKGTNTLYQIPVISYTGLDYGTYNVTINVNAPVTALGIDSSVFYLDAIRIYDPMGTNNSENSEFDEANEAYNTDNEANAYVASIRDFIIQAKDLDVSNQFGAVYVDTLNNDYSSSGTLNPGDYETPTEPDPEAPGRDVLAYRTLNQTLIKDFELLGPNEEVYLSPGYGVGFEIEATERPASVQLEMKVPSPIANGATLLAQTYGQPVNPQQDGITVSSATEMFYDITDKVVFTQQDGSYKATVVLSNNIVGANVGEIVSITNIKLTYPEGTIATDSADEGMFSFDSKENVVFTSIQSSWSTYEDVFDTVYVQRMASTPDYDITSAKSEKAVATGGTAVATVKTSRFVNELVIKDSYGNIVTPTSVKCETDESKFFTEDFEEAKVWTVSFKAYGANGTVGYTAESADGEGKVGAIDVTIKNPKVKSISVYKKPDKISYKIGEQLDDSGLRILVTYDDGTTKVISSGFTTESQDFTKSGTYSVKVNYGGQQTSFNVKVKASVIQVIAKIFGLGWLFKK